MLFGGYSKFVSREYSKMSREIEFKEKPQSGFVPKDWAGFNLSTFKGNFKSNEQGEDSVDIEDAPEDLEDKILDRVKNEGKLVSFPLKQLLRVAAAISIFGLGLWWITYGTEMDPLASVDSDEAIEYLLEEIGQVEYNDLTDVAAIDLEHMPYDMADINSDEVDDYLNDNIDRIEYNLIDETEYEK